jgi:hypothetical protein
LTSSFDSRGKISATNHERAPDRWRRRADLTPKGEAPITLEARKSYTVEDPPFMKWVVWATCIMSIALYAVGFAFIAYDNLLLPFLGWLSSR